MSSYVYKKGDTAPHYNMTMVNGCEPLDLTAATEVRVVCKRLGTRVVKFDRAATIVSPPTAGKIVLHLLPTDTDTPGIYTIEAVVQWATGHVGSVPSNSFDLFTVADR